MFSRDKKKDAEMYKVMVAHLKALNNARCLTQSYYEGEISKEEVPAKNKEIDYEKALEIAWNTLSKLLNRSPSEVPLTNDDIIARILRSGKTGKTMV